tara:strand:+ start:7307 stop:9439 length:2133 start_codon:yes stop_codon:yes gene_type:complete
MIMQTKFFKYITRAMLISALCLASFGAVFTSCDDDDDDGMTTGVVLESFGPMPIARGAQLSFIGRNLDQVTAIVLPSSLEITEFGTKSPGLITLTVPQNAVEGFVVLKTPQGEIKTKTEIGYMEPISIESFTPTSIKAGQELTIKGDYLNLVKEVIFTDRAALGDTAFITQSRTELKLLVPAEAQSGKIAVSNGAEDPVIVYSEADLTVTLPAFTEISPNPVKAGEMLTITGTNLDLVEKIVLGGEKNITEFESQSETKIELNVPSDTQDGKVTMVPASMVAVVSEVDLILVVPTVGVAPTTVKNGGGVTITGTNLDLITKVEFAGGAEGTVSDGGTDTEIIVTVPELAVSGEIVFSTAAGKTVSGGEITIVAPSITGFEPASGKPNTDVVITGADLDLVAKVVFTGGLEGTISAQSETSLTVSIPVGAQTGAISLIAINGVELKTASDFEVLSNLPDFTSYTEPRGEPGKILTLNGTKLDLIKELIFPGGVTATAYGMKTDTKVEVYVPESVTWGFGQITMTTYEGEEGLLPQIYFGGIQAIVDPSLIINDFDEEGHDLSWDNWGGQVALGSDPALGISGNYMVGANTAINGWSWIWGCNHDQLPKVSVMTADHVLKMDINITKPLLSTDYSFTMKLAGTDISIGKLGLEYPDGSHSTPGWITITFDLADYDNLPETIPASGDWGMTYWASTPNDITGLYIDNIRFEKK